MRELVQTLQDLLEKVTIISNYSVDLVDGEAIYYSLKLEDGTYADGSWRRIQVLNDLEDQVKIAGVWTFVARRERPE